MYEVHGNIPSESGSSEDDGLSSSAVNNASFRPETTSNAIKSTNREHLIPVHTTFGPYIYVLKERK